MAELIRSAKSASKWTDYDLQTYNIIITPTPPETFFQGHESPSLGHLDQAILSLPVTGVPFPHLSQEGSAFRSHLRTATRGMSQGRAANAQLAVSTLRLLGYETGEVGTLIGFTNSLDVCGKTWKLRMDVCIGKFVADTTLLVLEQDKSKRGVPSQVDARVVVAAIAVFQSNNASRVESGRPVLDSMTIPCTTMTGTVPAFYLIPVSKRLSDAVRTGQYPEVPTHVSKCSTATTPQDGMADPLFRQLVLRRFLAFLPIAKNHWEQFV
ncbi:hypothetical protein D9619_005540 [Psilocybe cf. subviscida]|uniref:Uncharacterized protein n=1 Tax=Psilocybe cf. subviscida TaxID=2480587 RepID=A0A8H5FBN9_9AGAR|nr:hypothetical protein D9619_005540 [Psilocybe cf. subviscida]